MEIVYLFRARRIKIPQTHQSKTEIEKSGKKLRQRKPQAEENRENRRGRKMKGKD